MFEIKRIGNSEGFSNLFVHHVYVRLINRHTYSVLVCTHASIVYIAWQGLMHSRLVCGEALDVPPSIRLRKLVACTSFWLQLEFNNTQDEQQFLSSS